jgi:hypothetical protein
MVEFTITGEALWDRMERAVARVNERLRKTVRILEVAKITHDIVGGHAVRAWVAQVDEGAVRTTKHVDVLLRRDVGSNEAQFLSPQRSSAPCGHDRRRIDRPKLVRSISPSTQRAAESHSG